MKHGGTRLVWLAGSLVLCAGATASSADAPENPYKAVVERNVFGLKPPPPPPDLEANKPPLPKITLTGIITVGGAKRALMKTPPPQPKPGETPKTEQGFILAVGEREGEVEVLEIDEKAGIVKVNYGGTVRDLDFDKDGVKGAAAPQAPGAPPGMKTSVGPPGARGGAGGAAPIPGRWPRTPGGVGSFTPPAAGGAGPSVAPQVASVNPSVPAPTAAPQEAIDTETSQILLEVNRIKYQPLVDAGEWPPLPPGNEEIRAAILGPEPAATPEAAPAQAPAQMTLPLPPGGPQQFPPQAPQ